MNDKDYVLGIDFGTDSVRCLLASAAEGWPIAFSEYSYQRWKKGLYCQPGLSIFRQHPLDYTEGLERCVRECLVQAGPTAAAKVRALSMDTTGSTPVAVDAAGMPLALLPAFSEDPDAMFILWKDHSSRGEAADINAQAKKFAAMANTPDYLRYAGGIYSSEWFWSKLLYVLRRNTAVRAACHSWVEHCDWMPFLLTGGRRVEEMRRSVCTAGHKALWSPDWGGLPPDNFFSDLDPLLAGFTARLYRKTYTADTAAGRLCPEWAQRLGLHTGVIVGVGAMDAHMGAVGGQIEPYHLSKVMGTSTCDMLVAPEEDMAGKYVPGICGLVNGSILPGMTGMEAGQSAFGDVYAWFAGLLAWTSSAVPVHDPASVRANDPSAGILPLLSEAAEKIPILLDSEWSLDWFNGRRTPDANAFVKGQIGGLHLGSDAPAIFRSLVESTCFGSRAIVERFRDQRIPVKGLIGIGGIARKSPFIMQMLADVLDMPIRINRSGQTAALGAAMFAATIAGLYDRVEDAMQAMGQGFDRSYRPDPDRAAIYRVRYERYKAAGHFAEELDTPSFNNM